MVAASLNVKGTQVRAHAVGWLGSEKMSCHLVTEVSVWLVDFLVTLPQHDTVSTRRPRQLIHAVHPPRVEKYLAEKTRGPRIWTICLTTAVSVNIENIKQMYHHMNIEKTTPNDLKIRFAIYPQPRYRPF